MWHSLFLYRRVLYFWTACFILKQICMILSIFLRTWHCNSKIKVYIYKRPYVHFPVSFLRQNCDHMCIIKILFNPLPMKIFWKEAYLCILFFKDKMLCILFKSIFCVNISFWWNNIDCWREWPKSHRNFFGGELTRR